MCIYQRPPGAAISRFGLPCKGIARGLLNLSYNEGMICNLLATYRKSKQLVKHLELLVIGNVAGD